MDILSIESETKNHLNLDEDKLSKVAEQLNQLLVDYNIYYQNLRNFHWNITGKNFFELHEKFQALYTDARVTIDDIAERVLTLGHSPISRFSEYLKLSNIEEALILEEDEEMVKTLLINHKCLIGDMRKLLKSAAETNDEGTVDMIAGFLGAIEKESWMLSAWLESK